MQEQWAHTLKLISAPQNSSLLNPGQCIRIGIVSSGDNRDDYLMNTKLSFTVRFAGHSDLHPLAALSGFKQIKPEGLDFVTAALSAGGLRLPDRMKTMASLGASLDRWCAPMDAADGTATVEVEVESPAGHHALTTATLAIETFDTGSKRSFTEKEFDTFLQVYYRQPNPARLLPAMQFMLAQQSQNGRKGQAEIVAAFLAAALKADPIAAKDFRTRIAAQPPMIRSLGLLVLRSAGYDISGVLNALIPEAQEKFLSITPLPDPFDLAPTREIFQHLDLLWAVFGATGQFEPVATVATALNWGADYQDFDKLRKTPDHSSTFTPSLARGVTYMAAGWSLHSFQKLDPLVADYIDYLLASPGTSQLEKTELTGLSTNPAFKRD